MKQNTRRNGEHHKLYNSSILHIHTLQDIRKFFAGAHGQHAFPVQCLGVSCSSIRALEKEFSNHIHSISQHHFPLTSISSLVHQLHCDPSVLLLSFAILGGFLTSSAVIAEETESFSDGSNFIVDENSYQSIQLKADGNIWQKDKDDAGAIVATLEAGPGYEIAKGESGNENEVYWFWLTNPSGQPTTEVPSLTVRVNEGASFDMSGDKIKRSFTVGNHKLFYIDTTKPSTQNLLNSAQQKWAEEGELFGEYVIDKGEYKSIIYRNKDGDEVDTQLNILKIPVLSVDGEDISKRYISWWKEGNRELEIILGYQVSTDQKNTLTFAGTPVDALPEGVTEVTTELGGQTITLWATLKEVDGKKYISDSTRLYAKSPDGNTWIRLVDYNLGTEEEKEKGFFWNPDQKGLVQKVDENTGDKIFNEDGNPIYVFKEPGIGVAAPQPIGMILGSYRTHVQNVGATPSQAESFAFPWENKKLSDFKNSATLNFNLGAGSHSSFQVIYAGKNDLGGGNNYPEDFPDYNPSLGTGGSGGSNGHTVNISFEKGPDDNENKTEFRFSGIFGGRGAQHGQLSSASNNKIFISPADGEDDARLNLIAVPDWMKGYIFGGEAWNASGNLVYLENVDARNLNTELGIVGGRGIESFHFLDYDQLTKEGYKIEESEASGRAYHNVVIIKNSTFGQQPGEEQEDHPNHLLNYANESANIYGGYSYGIAENNIVSVENSTINGHIYGGFELLNRQEETAEQTSHSNTRNLHGNLVSLHNVTLLGTSAIHGVATGNVSLKEELPGHIVADEDSLQTINGRRGVAYLAGDNLMSSAYVRYIHFGQYYDSDFLATNPEKVNQIELDQSYYLQHWEGSSFEGGKESPSWIEGVIYTNDPRYENYEKEKIEIGQLVGGSYLFLRGGIHSSLDARDDTESDVRNGTHNFWVGAYANLTNQVNGDGTSLNTTYKLFKDSENDKPSEEVNHEYTNGTLSLLTHDDGMIVNRNIEGKEYNLLDAILHDDGYRGRVLYLSVNNGYDESGENEIPSVSVALQEIRDFRQNLSQDFRAHGNTAVGVAIFGDPHVYTKDPSKDDPIESATLESLSFDVPGFLIKQNDDYVGEATYSFFKYLKFDGKATDVIEPAYTDIATEEIDSIKEGSGVSDQGKEEVTSYIQTEEGQEGGDGLAYWLKSVDIYNGKMLILHGLTENEKDKPEAGLSPEEERGRYTLSAFLHGKGGIIVPDSNKVIIGDPKSPYLRSAEDSLNDYEGPTLVGKSAVLTQELNSALGNTYLLDVSEKGQYQLLQHKQTIGGLEESADATIDLGEKGHLTVQKNSEKASAIAHINGSVEGDDASMLTVNNGYLVSTAPSSDFYGTFELKGATTGVFESNKSAHHAKVKIDKQASLYMNSAQPYEAGAETSAVLSSRANDASSVPDFELNNTSSIERKIAYTGSMQNDGNLYLSKGMSVDNLNEVHVGLDKKDEQAYQSQQGNIHYSIVMNSDDSPTDFVQAHGDASGESFLYFSNLEGSKGARTKEGIPVFFIDGKSDLTLKLGAPAAAGAYYYDLISREDGTKWYLVNNENHLRAESGSYINNMQSIAWMEMRLHDRYGQSHWIDRFEGSEKQYAGWVRQVGVHSHNKVGGGQVKIHSLTGLTQAGLDLYRTHFNEEYDLGAHFDVFAGALYNKAKSKSLWTFKSQVDGYALGIYGTLFGGNGPDEKFYVDSWLSWGNYDNKIYGPLPEFKYKSRGWTASVEAGYHINLGETGEKPKDYLLWTLQPQAQVIWNGVRSKDAVDSTHTRYEAIGDKNGTLRLGARLNADHEGKWVAALEGNWIHRFKDIGVKMNGKKIFADGGRNVGEARVIYEGHLSQNLLGWSTLTYRKGSHGFHEESAQIGVRYMF